MQTKLTIFFALLTINLFSQTHLFFNTNNSLLSSNNIISIKHDFSNAYWIVTAPEFNNSIQISHGGLHKFYNNTWETYDSLANLSLIDIVNDVEIDKDNKILVGTSNGLIIKDSQSTTLYNITNSPLPNNNIFTITVDSNNKYYLGIPNYGVTVFENNTWTNYNYQNSFNGIEDLNFIFVDKSNNVWIGTDYFGLYMFDGLTWQQNFNNTFDGKTCYIMGIDEDSSGIKHIAFQTSEGKHYIASGADYPFNIVEINVPEHPFSFWAYNSIKTDYKNNIYAGTSNGLFVNKANNWTVLDSSDFNVSGNYYTSLFVDKNNNKIFCVGHFLQNKTGLLFYNEDGVTFTKMNEKEPNGLSFTLSQNYPNPFNPSTTINFTLPKAEHTTIKIYDTLGRELATLCNEELNAGTYSKNWNASNFSSGVYFCKVNAGNYRKTIKMLLTK